MRCIKSSATGLLAGLGACSQLTTRPAEAQVQFDRLLDVPTVYDVTGSAIFDFNSDGLNDVAFAEQSDKVSVLLNRGGGAFQFIGYVDRYLKHPSLLRTADFDRDGHADLVWVEDTSTLVFLFSRGDGRGGRIETANFGGVSGIAVGDLDGDQFPDIVLVDHIQGSSGRSTYRILVNDHGSFSQSGSVSLVYNDSRDVVIGDIDCDGDNDVAILNLKTQHDSYSGWKIYDSEINVLLNDGQGAFTPGRRITLPFGQTGFYDPMPLALIPADLDGDADLDFAVAAVPFHEQGPTLMTPVESIESGQSFEIRPDVEVGDNAWERATLVGRDIDTDGDIDLIDARGWFVENTSDFTFAVSPLVLNASSRVPPTLGDLDGDGQVDLIVGTTTGLALLGNSMPYFGPTLDSTRLRRGRVTTLTVYDAQPEEVVQFGFSFEPEGASEGLPRFGGLTLDMVRPIHFIGTSRADANGTAEFTVPIPNDAPLRSVILQAVIHRGPGGVDSVKTPFRTARITE